MTEKSIEQGKAAPISRAQWLELEPHVDRALELSAEQRRGYIANVYAQDAALGAELERFVAESERADPRIDVSAPERFAALFDDHLPSPLAPNTLLADRYLIQREIGRGGMAIVYFASDLKLNHASVAVKVMRRGSLTTRAGKRFDEEIRLTSRLRHPNIVQLSDRGELAEHAFFVMPHVEGETLRARLEREQSGRISIPEALRIGIDIARALDYAHNHDVIHRDVKPSNLLLTSGVAMLADFGIARAAALSEGLDDADPLTDVGVRVGTPAYMSPEQSDGSEEVDAQTDIYSLGCVLYEMISGERPTQALRRIAEMARGSDPVRPLRERRGGGEVSPALEACITSALAVRKADRTRTAADLERALERCAREYGVTITPWKRLYWRAPRVVVAGAVASMLMVVVATMWLVRHMAPAADGDQGTSPVQFAAASMDTTRIMVLPFSHGGAAGRHDEDDRLRDALKRWDGIDAVDRLETREALSHHDTARLTATVARDVGRAVRAPRYIRGEVSASGDTSVIRAGLYDARTGTALANATAATRRPAADSVFDALVLQLLFPQIAESTVIRLRSATRSRPALQAYARSQNDIAAWDLPRADTDLVAATNADSRFALAYLWLAQVRSWRELDRATWQFAAYRAGAARASLSPHDRRVADALTTTDTATACTIWRSLTKEAAARDDFAAWYDVARCDFFDHAILRDPRSPSGWRFRSSYQDATEAYRRAFQILPAIHRAFRSNWYSSLKNTLRTQRTQLRLGKALPPDTGRFAAYASWSATGDSLEFIPYPLRAIENGRAGVVPASSAQAADHQRHVFLEIARTWRTAFGPNADALLAVAVALDELGDSTAIDSVFAARRLADLAGDVGSRSRVASEEVWMLVKRSVPNDPKRLATARDVADSLLRGTTEHVDSVQAFALASLAALTGHVHQAARYSRVARDVLYVPVRLQSAVRALQAYAALGAPIDSIRAIATLIWTTTDTASALTRSDWMRRAARIAFPVYHDSTIVQLARAPDYLALIESAWLDRDTATVRRRLAALRDARRVSAPEDLKLEALYPEAWVLASAGDPRAALDWITPTLDAQARSSIEILQSAVAGGALVHAMVLRAQLASRLGRTAEAAQWARAVVALWRDADDELQPIVREMSRLAR